MAVYGAPRIVHAVFNGHLQQDSFTGFIFRLYDFSLHVTFFYCYIRRATVENFIYSAQHFITSLYILQTLRRFITEVNIWMITSSSSRGVRRFTQNIARSATFERSVRNGGKSIFAKSLEDHLSRVTVERLRRLTKGEKEVVRRKHSVFFVTARIVRFRRRVTVVVEVRLRVRK